MGVLDRNVVDEEVGLGWSPMKPTPTGLLPLACLATFGLGASACAEVYVPRPSGAVVVTSNGGSGYKVWKNGEEMGSEWAVGDAVAGDPKAEAQAEKASSERVGSIVTGIGGAIAVGVGAALLSYDGFNSTSNGNSFSNGVAGASIGLLVGGLVLYIVSGSLQGASHTHMFNAVNIYNDDVAGRGTRVVREVPIIAAPPGYLPPGRSPGVIISPAPGPGYAPVPVPPALPPPSQPLVPLPAPPTQ
jgi:hypothetical protein